MNKNINDPAHKKIDIAKLTLGVEPRNDYLVNHINTWANVIKTNDLYADSLYCMSMYTDDGDSYVSVDTRLPIILKAASNRIKELEAKIEELRWVERIVEVTKN